MNDIKAAAAAVLCERVHALNESAELTAAEITAMFEYPPDPKLGDLAFPCFRLAKLLRTAPPKIAVMLSEGLTVPGVERVACVGGYLNFFVDKTATAVATVNRILDAETAGVRMTRVSAVSVCWTIPLRMSQSPSTSGISARPSSVTR